MSLIINLSGTFIGDRVKFEGLGDRAMKGLGFNWESEVIRRNMVKAQRSLFLDWKSWINIRCKKFIFFLLIFFLFVRMFPGYMKLRKDEDKLIKKDKTNLFFKGEFFLSYFRLECFFVSRRIWRNWFLFFFCYESWDIVW